MSIQKIQGVVLKTINYDDYDKIITIFSDKLGKIDVMCNGARRTKSKLLHLTQQFCYGEYIITKGKNLYTLSSGSLIESFQNIIQNYDKLVYGSYFLEFVEKVSEKENKNVYLLALLLKTLYVLDSEVVKFDLLKVVFDFKIISLIGYTPQVLRCVRCGNINLKGAFFSNEDGGLLCNNCSNGRVNFNNTEIQFLQTIRNIKLDNLGKIIYDEYLVKKVDKILEDYIYHHLSLKLNSLQFLQTFK